MLIKMLGAVAVAFALLLVYAATRPDSFRVERRVFIAAAPEKVFPWLEDPRKASEWSPWDKKDPGMKKTYSGAAKGVGAMYEWDGNKEIGAGRLTILQSDAPARVVMRLEFLRPMKAVNTAAYFVTPKDGGSEVSWSIEGPSPFLSKLICVFMDMDAMIGGEFEKGLGDLKTLVEKK